MSFREGSRTRWLTLAAGAVIVSALAIAAWAMFGLAGGGNDDRAFAVNGDGEVCPNPVDISLVFDHTGSMDDVAGKIENAKAAAVGFVNAFAGGPLDNDLDPHQIALTGFSNGTANMDEPLTTNAANLRTDINGYSTTGRTHIGLALQLAQLQLEPPADADAEPDTNDYMVLLSDGAANVPADVDEANTTGSSGINNDFFIDVNDNGIRDSGDDLSLDFPRRRRHRRLHRRRTASGTSTTTPSACRP